MLMGGGKGPAGLSKAAQGSTGNPCAHTRCPCCDLSCLEHGTQVHALQAARPLARCPDRSDSRRHSLLSPQAIIRSFRTAAQLAVDRVKELAVDIGSKDLQEKKEMLEKCAQTSLNSKLVS